MEKGLEGVQNALREPPLDTLGALSMVEGRSAECGMVEAMQNAEGRMQNGETGTRNAVFTAAQRSPFLHGEACPFGWLRATPEPRRAGVEGRKPETGKNAPGPRRAGSGTLFGASMFGAESDGTPAARTIYYNYPTSGDGAGNGRLDKSGDVSGLASRGTYEKIPKIGIPSTEIHDGRGRRAYRERRILWSRG